MRNAHDTPRRLHTAYAPAVLAFALPLVLGAVVVTPPPAASSAGQGLQKQPDGIVVPVADGVLKVAFCTDEMVRVAFAKEASFFDRKSLAAGDRKCGTPQWTLGGSARQPTLESAKLRVRIDLGTGTVAFLDRAGRPILVERRNGRSLEPADVQGEKTYHVRQQWEPTAAESLYGLGQHQLGLMDIKGYDLELWQHNGTVIVPFIASSRGYGILWDNTSYSRFGDVKEAEPIPASELLDKSGKPGGLTGSYYAGAAFEKLVATRLDPVISIEVPGGTQKPNTQIHPDLPPEGNISVRWEGDITPFVTGDHLFETFSNGGIKMWIDDRLLIDHWRQGWLPWWDVARVRLQRGRRHHVRLEWTKDQGMETMRLLWKAPPRPLETSLWSEVGDGIDYYFVYGPEMDGVIAGYRKLTGEAPLMPIWAFGLFQSRERYRTAQESLDVLEGFRSRRIPIDTIVQDWQYWKEDAWGSHKFDPARFPDPDGWVRAIHDKYHARLLLSVWGKFYPGSENFDAMRSRGFLYEPNLKDGLRDWLGHPYTFYDAFNADGRRLFWEQVRRDLFVKGVDAWWMDATEPDLMPTPTLEGQRTHVHPTALGTGARVLNAYSLVNSEAVYVGQRQAAPDQRVFILTRSAFSGQQRYAAATWSGDITSTWTAFRQQIPAGLSFSLSGIPYWTTDIGGFSVPGRFAGNTQKPEDAEEWRELNARWFQFGTFCPLLRVHGQFPYREMWFLGGESHPAYQTELKFDRLRYRMLPYVYSLAGEITHRAGTMMRALVMDFPGDLRARAIGDEYMFGPAFLVSPVTTYKARTRTVYLPAGSAWYDFWTGRALTGGQTIEADAPYDSLPLHIRAGSIVPLGPELEYTTEKTPDPITLYIYAGADGAFTLYEDEGTNYGYERGAFSRIPLRWNDATATLTIGAREGSFPGMLRERTFLVVRVAGTKATGFSFTPTPDRTVRYAGTAVDVSFR
jgi:alpha-D-xyloside xylohydrolase